jgi:hypothetical protein
LLSTALAKLVGGGTEVELGGAEPPPPFEPPLNDRGVTEPE